MRTASFIDLFKRLRSDERGQSLAIVTLAMTTVIGMGAMGIDVGNWYAQHHQDQLVADAAALAAANCLAHPNVTSGLGPTCTSATDKPDATTVAVDYAQANGLTIAAGQVSIDTSTDQVSVQANSTAPALFAKLFGISSVHPHAASVAAWKTGPTPCSQATSAAQCSAIYAGNTSCSGTGIGVMTGTPSSGGASVTVQGIVHTEGQMTFSNATMSASALTVAGSCYSSGNMPSNNRMTATQVASEPWPIDYSQSPYFSACTTTCTVVSGVAGVPSYCTQATTNTTGYDFTNINGNPELPVSGNVYCSIGTGTPSNPATWNGPIKIEASDPANGCGSTYPKDTFIGGNVSFITSNGGGTSVCLSPDMYNCLIYSTGNVAIYNGTFNWTGDIFVPKGTIQLGTANAGGDSDKTTSGMLEGLNVDMQNVSVNMTGDGTVAGSGSGSAGGSDVLVQ